MDFRGLSDPVVITNKQAPRSNIFQRIKPPSTNFFKNKKFLGGALTVLLLFAVGIGVFISQKPTQLKPQAESSGAEISIQPPSSTVSLNEEFTQDIFINSPDDLSISAVKAKIDFPSSLQLTDVTIGDFLPIFLVPPQTGTSSVTLVMGSLQPKKGTGVLAKLKFKVISNLTQPVNINFDTSQTQAAAIETGDINQAIGLQGSQVSLQGNNTSPSSSPVSSKNPQSSPTPCLNSLLGCSDSSPEPSPTTEACPSAPICQAGTTLITGDSQTSNCPVYVCIGSSPSPSPSPSKAPSPSPSPSKGASPTPCLNSLTGCGSPTPSASQSKGDGNNDGKVDLQDLSIMFSKWSPAVNITSYFQLDFNDDSRINSLDYGSMRALLLQLGIIRQ